MQFCKITIRNYRNIPYESPVTLEIKEGITFILGLNNIGKSNLLLFFEELNNILKADTVDHNSFVAPNTIQFIIPENLTFSKIRNRQDSKDRPILIDFEDSNGTKLSLLLKDAKRRTSSFDIISVHVKDKDGQYYSSGLKLYEQACKSMSKFVYDLFYNSIYVPSTRTASADYIEKKNKIVFGKEFISTWESWSAGDDEICRMQLIKLQIELAKLFGYNNLSIRVNKNKDNLIFDIDENSFLINELGTGIVHITVVLANALIHKPAFIFIDEPENALHPKMQETFIRALAAKTKYGIIATSHSIGLARSTADHIYSYTKIGDKKLRLAPFGMQYRSSINQTIGEMGYSQFVEIGGSHILLVEGRTDIKCFREILRKYNIEQHFIIIDLGGGSNITNDASKITDELNELKRLNATSISVIFDSDREREGAPLTDKHQGFTEICKTLGFNVLSTKYHSTENYITQEAIKEIMSHEKYKALEPYENFNKAKDRKWPKEKNWLMFREMSKSDFDNTDIGDFIQNILMKKL